MECGVPPSVEYSDGKRNYKLLNWYTPIPIEYLRWRSSVAKGSKRSSLYRAMQQQAFYFISRKYVHDVQQK
ncbi:hypothetical protein NQ318_001633 [Aromia moschata]|uniref:Uncharacterized protein n=1 Tax=Aromia moschata TaxID=1265417 RepID=A0AAV8Y4L8_9CUCU|nr:hypothetical protein NQ318_001633 [Aromia moschata]